MKRIVILITGILLCSTSYAQTGPTLPTNTAPAPNAGGMPAPMKKGAQTQAETTPALPPLPVVDTKPYEAKLEELKKLNLEIDKLNETTKALEAKNKLSLQRQAELENNIKLLKLEYEYKMLKQQAETGQEVNISQKSDPIQTNNSSADVPRPTNEAINVFSGSSNFPKKEEKAAVNPIPQNNIPPAPVVTAPPVNTDNTPLPETSIANSGDSLSEPKLVENPVNPLLDPTPEKTETKGNEKFVSEKKKDEFHEQLFPVVSTIYGTGDNLKADLLIPRTGQVTVSQGDLLPEGLIVEIINEKFVIVSHKATGKILTLPFGDKVPK